MFPSLKSIPSSEMRIHSLGGKWKSNLKISLFSFQDTGECNPIFFHDIMHCRYFLLSIKAVSCHVAPVQHCHLHMQNVFHAQSLQTVATFCSADDRKRYPTPSLKTIKPESGSLDFTPHPSRNLMLASMATRSCCSTKLTQSVKSCLLC
eukprot:gnl/MRDRNA2_/MRDRNA2_25698_c0_seq1.p1 gnl/MRDRNA2_/MRDRNA2_25698_c0~~gnl/MRDRNA2_/MRDRNA2_25698_c0_seq1.p1  ORF type:complete len:171 (-),score=16.23 gnl/MRDRNA2_/MRDRNA2_25698_c0_seq1:38-484(-)